MEYQIWNCFYWDQKKVSDVKNDVQKYHETAHLKN
jgi:hypothetical protein